MNSIPIRLAALATLSLAATPLSAQELPEDQQHRSAHDDQGAIVVTGHLPVDYTLLAAAVELGGDDLLRETRGQIGDTLARLPGVSATGFAPGASRPVLRGFEGDRIRVLVDGIGSIDASNVSADHAVVFDPLTVDHIDVIHGPAALVFGGQAIGGAVNGADRRIPRTVPENGYDLRATAGYGSAADERSAGAALDIALAPRFVAHADASWRKSDDLRVAGYIASPTLRGDLLADAAEHVADGEGEDAAELVELANRRGRVAGTAAEATTFGAGLAFIDTGGTIGVSFQRHDSRYGVPLRPGAGHGHGHGEEQAGAEEEHGDVPVSIDLGQTRFDLRAAVQLGGLFDSLHLRGAYGDYRHVELEGSEVGTTFSGKGLEARLDLVQRNNGGWRGRSGVQVLSRKLTIVGDEAFTPNNEISRLGLFTLQSLRFGEFEAEAAGRYERARVEATSAGFDRQFDLWSAALGLSWQPTPELKLGASWSRGARAPSPEELLSDGVHVATQSYELGNPDFGIERSTGYEAFVRFDTEALRLSATGFITDFENFITSAPNGEEEDGFPVMAYFRDSALYRGFELEGSVRLARLGEGEIRADIAADYVHAELGSGGAVPRIPPFRVRNGLEFASPALRLRGEVEWNARQGRVAALESPVEAFTLVNLSADWHPFGAEGPLTLILSADNLLNASGRRAASLTRDFVPISGRDLRLTASIGF